MRGVCTGGRLTHPNQLSKAFLAKLRASMRKVVCPVGEIGRHVPLQSSVFDLGCGTGAVLAELIQSRQVRRVGGSETCPVLLSTARKITDEILGQPATKGDFFVSESPPGCLHSYDCILLIDVLHHIPRAKQSDYLCRTAKNMRSGAKFILKDINAGRASVYCNRLHDALFAGNGFQEISINQAKDLLSAAGLKVLHSYEVQRLWYPHYFLIAQKG